jgi:hypothetical protein
LKVAQRAPNVQLAAPPAPDVKLAARSATERAVPARPWLAPEDRPQNQGVSG